MRYSIIIPCYNESEWFLRQCLDSINCVEDYCEVILVDDGSDSFPKNVLNDYKFVRYYRQNNQGVSVARNKGIELASGEYILFVDSDDRLDKECFSKIDEIIEKKPQFDVLIGTNDVIGKKQSVGDMKVESIQKIDLISSVLSHYEIRNDLSCGAPWAKVFRREFLLQNEILFKPGLKKCQDRIFMLYAYEKSQKIFFLNSPLYAYRDNNPNSVCNRYNAEIDQIMGMVMSSAKEFVDLYYRDNSEIKKDYQRMKISLTMSVLKLKYLRDESHAIGYTEYKKQISEYVDRNKIIWTIKDTKMENSLKRRFLLMFLERKWYWVLYLYGVIFK